MTKIVFFNHYHRGDLFTSKEYVRQIMRNYPGFEYEYWHYNHPKIVRDLGITTYLIPEQIDRNSQFVKIDNTTYAVNTWWDVFEKHGGVNMLTLNESWQNIFNLLNLYCNTKLLVSEAQDYIPTVDYSCFNVSPVDKFVMNNRKRALFCNGVPMSSQSFFGDMSDVINEFAFQHPHVDFICTKRIESKEPNVYFTDDITETSEEYPVNVPWNDRETTGCDLNEISYLSTKCDLIVGKNSGPFVFCETKDNFMDENKHIISFSKGSRESMSYEMLLKCKYQLITDHKPDTIKSVLGQALATL